jgi:hypothetical protein
MSLQAVKSGQTNPFEVAKYLKAGALVFTCANLHAKLYVFDKTAVVCSGNLSLHSQNTLVEAGIITKESNVLQSAIGFIKSLQVEPITPEYIKLCKKSYMPPKFWGGGKLRQIKKRVVPTYSRLWLSGIFDVDFSAEEDRISEREAREAIKEIKNKKHYEINSIRWGGDSHFTRTVRKGDLIIQIYEGKAYPPSRIVKIGNKYKISSLKKKRFFVHIEDEINPKSIKWTQFKKSLSAVRLGNVTPRSTREVKSPTASHTLLGLWN